MTLQDKKLGILLSAGPNRAAFQHGLRLAGAALRRGLSVYVYCIDDAVHGLRDPELQGLKKNGLHLFACAYSARRRSIPVSDDAVFSGLATASDLISGTDRFVGFS